MDDDHHHCRICGRVCDPDAEFCSRKCEAKRAESVATRRRWLYILFALMALTILLSVVNYHLY